MVMEMVWRRGFGRGWQEYPTIIQPQSPEQEIETLEAHQINLESEKADLEGEMKEIKSRIEKLKATPKQ